MLSRAGEDFFLGGLALALLPLCCCWRHLALRFLNHTYGGRDKRQELTKQSQRQQGRKEKNRDPLPVGASPENITGENWRLLSVQVHFHTGPLVWTSQGLISYPVDGSKITGYWVSPHTGVTLEHQEGRIM